MTNEIAVRLVHAGRGKYCLETDSAAALRKLADATRNASPIVRVVLA